MYGGFAGLEKVETDRWGGLPLTIMLSSLSMMMAFPIAHGRGPGAALQRCRPSAPSAPSTSS
jgi:hypothetical protein